MGSGQIVVGELVEAQKAMITASCNADIKQRKMEDLGGREVWVKCVADSWVGEGGSRNECVHVESYPDGSEEHTLGQRFESYIHETAWADHRLEWAPWESKLGRLPVRRFSIVRHFLSI